MKMPKNRALQAERSLGEGWLLSVYDARYDAGDSGYAAEIERPDDDDADDAIPYEWGETIGDAIMSLNVAISTNGTLAAMPAAVAVAWQEEMLVATKNKKAKECDYMAAGTGLVDPVLYPALAAIDPPAGYRLAQPGEFDGGKTHLWRLANSGLEKRYGLRGWLCGVVPRTEQDVALGRPSSLPVIGAVPT